MKSKYTIYKFLLFVFLLAFALPELVKAQSPAYPFGNEWINYSQTYYKIGVIKNGIHRLDFNYLNKAGFSSADPRKFQLFRRGKEVSIHVNGEADGKLDNGDYVEFYGERNDGKTDVELYKRPEYLVHDFFSLYTDTAAYFLTVSPNNGKRIINKSITQPLAPSENWHYSTRLYLEKNIYSDGFDLGPAGTALPYGDKAEGFFSEFFGTQSGGQTNNPATFRVDSLLNVETSGPEPTMEIALVGTFTRDHNVSISVVPPSGMERIIGANVQFAAFDHVKLKYPLQFADINPNGTVTVRVKVNTVVEPGGTPDWIRLAYIKVRYPRKNIFNQKNLFISLSDSNKISPSYLVFDNTTANTVAYDVTDQANIYRVSGLVNLSQRGFQFDGSPGKQRKILVTALGTYINPMPGKNRQFKIFTPALAKYIIISNKKLTLPVNGSNNPVRDYANYRASLAGGKHDTIVFYVDQLYDQFHYGDRSALAIRRLMRFLIQNGKPENLLLLGKGVELNQGSGFGSGGRGFRFNPNSYPIFDLVPTGGVPGSDILFTADFQNNSYFPRVPTGRIPAINASDIVSYLEKVKNHENLAENEPWRKNVLHLSGGIGIAQQQQFKNYVQSYEEIIEGPLLGANVQTITKLGSSEVSSFINVAKEVNTGLSLMTFFGHSSTTISDIDIGYVSNPVNGYNNFNKYPMILLNGCASGNAFVSSLSRSFGEDWIITPRKGAIAFLGHSATGTTTELNIYSRNFYNTAFRNPEFYGKSIGVQNQEIVKRTTSNNQNGFIITGMEMVLQGDPAIVLVGPSKPDYVVDAANFSIRPINKTETVTATSNKFQIAIPVKNFGKALNNPVTVSVSLNNEQIQDSVFVNPIYYQDTLFFNFTNASGIKAGLNQISVFIDHLNAIEEIDEVNNKGSFTYNFPSSGARPLFPVEYAIVKDREVKLIGQATDILQQNREYYFELDNSPSFKSADKQTKIVTAGAYPTWKVSLKPNIVPNDSMVYYWRFRFKDIAATEDTIWGESSFRYIPNSPSGWSQSEPGQFTKNTGKGISLNALANTFEFAPLKKNISIKTAGGQLPGSFPPYGIFVNGNRDFNGTCGLGNPTLLITVFNNKTLSPHVMPASMAPTVCGVDPRTFYHFNDLRQVANQEYLRRFLEAVPSGYYVAVVSVNNVPFSTFSENLKNAFRAVGSKLIDQVETGYPFALVGQKGSTVGSAQEATASSGDPVAPTSQNIELEGEIKARGSEGTITSTLIGPATEWQTLFHKVIKNGAGNDSYQIKVTGFDKQGKNQAVLAENITSRTFDLSNINAVEYPYLQLSLQVTDADDRSAPQLKEWIVTYTGVPEGIVRADTVGSERYTTLAKDGEKGKIDVKFAFQNISPDFDFKGELLARVSLIGKNGFTKELKVKPLAKKEAIIIPYTFATGNLEGKYILRFTVNPQDQNPNLQPEQYYFNNTLEIPFTLGPNLHPVLDVVFDGQHLMDGDIVSPNPNIGITLRDEDQFTLIKNPENMEVFIKAPDATDFVKVDLAGSEIKFFPATEQNPFKVEYTPQNLTDGIYTLRVQAKDGAGNSSGFEPYSINFEVINESSVTHFYPYPNPFSSKTRFVFTLTGATIPQDMKIQVMTITGKVVREIMKEELGPIKIGNNISEFAWDGTDEFGDKLANGVYLYRVIMETGAEEFKHRNTAADKTFKKDYGKLYILR